MTKSKTITCLVLITLSCLSSRVCQSSTNTAPVAIVVAFDKGKVHYQVDLKPVRSEQLLEVLGEIKRQRGREVPVVVLVDQRNSLASLSNIRGIVDKGGFPKVRYFYFTADRQRMAEIILDRPAMPFSLNPASDPSR